MVLLLDLLHIFYHLLPVLLCVPKAFGLHGRGYHNHSKELELPTDLPNITYDSGEYHMLIAGGYKPLKNTLTKYVVSIRTSRATAYFGDNHFCVGSIISDNLIMTAAHCVVDRRKVVTRPHRLVVVAGAPNRFQKLQTTVEMKVRDVLPHEYFKRKGEHDIALLRLVHHFPDDNDFVKIIGLTNKMVQPGTSCQILGWGQLFFRGPYSAHAIVANLTVFSQEYCRMFYRHHFHETMICAGKQGVWDADACRGDSGGPLICNDEVVAIVSWGSHCGEKGKPTIFTSVYHHRDWIKITSGSETVRHLMKPQHFFLNLLLIYFLLQT
ncbi:trypsin-3 [Bactrocera dorsalis]|uniref:Trypsin-3 n=1 Tax=Bactrocera dorsalis TaxID=27457 RepID=A0A6I9URY9_BACDO|nr:trypsin-3 [Bactrocera dorsalis]